MVLTAAADCQSSADVQQTGPYHEPGCVSNAFLFMSPTPPQWNSNVHKATQPQTRQLLQSFRGCRILRQDPEMLFMPMCRSAADSYQSNSLVTYKRCHGWALHLRTFGQPLSRSV